MCQNDKNQLFLTNIKLLINATISSLFFIFIFFNELSGAEKEIPISESVEYKVSDINFNSDSTINNIPAYLDYYYDGKDQYLFYLDKIGHNILMFNFDNNNLFKEIKISENIDGFCVHNLDSIFILLSYQNIVQLIDSSGALKQNYDLNPELRDSIRYLCFTRNYRRMQFVQNKLYIELGASVPPRLYYQYPTLAVFEIQSSSIKLSGKKLYFTEKYRQGIEYWAFHIYFTINKAEDIVYAYGVENDVFVCDKQNYVSQYPAKSNFIGNFMVFDTLNKSRAYDFKFQDEMPCYANIWYDKFRDCYYRFVWHQQKSVNPDGSKNEFFDKQWSIIVMDSKFNPLKEIIFPKGKYTFTECIITKDGLLISKNVENDQILSNTISFTLFKF